MPSNVEEWLEKVQDEDFFKIFPKAQLTWVHYTRYQDRAEGNVLDDRARIIADYLQEMGIKTAEMTTINHVIKRKRMTYFMAYKKMLSRVQKILQ